MTLQQLADQAFALHRAGRLNEAEPLYAQLAAKVPGNADLLFNHGVVLQALGRFDEALGRFDRVTTIRPADPGAWNARGAVLAYLGRAGEALASFDRALAIQPTDARFLLNRAMALLATGDFAAAAAAFDRVIAVDARLPEAWNNRGNALRGLGRLDEALASFDRAAALTPGDPGLHLNRGLALTDLGRFDEALAAFDRALALAPLYAEAANNRGLVLQYLGRRDEARAAFERAIQLDPAMAAAYLNYAGATTFTPDDPRLPAMEALLAHRDGMDVASRVQLDLALAKAHADLGDHGRSFEYLARGNRLQRSQIHYDEAAEMAFFDRIEAAFDEERMRALEALGGGDPSPEPVFILGMPRSGSTLVEQILAAHPQVHGAGELTAFHDAIRTVRAPDGSPVAYPELAATLDAEAIGRIAAYYLAEIRKRGGGAARVADKLPSNYYNIGLIRLALPGARIIHTVRDPLDTCVSRFAKQFIDQQGYCYDLGELGRYHRRYERLMDHWRRVLPAGAMLDVAYEQVIDDLEGQARRIVAYCGLEWDDRCLSFHTAARPVKTPSALQVRQPIYRGAIGRAAAYEPFLEPLKAALRDG